MDVPSNQKSCSGACNKGRGKTAIEFNVKLDRKDLLTQHGELYLP